MSFPDVNSAFRCEATLPVLCFIAGYNVSPPAGPQFKIDSLCKKHYTGFISIQNFIFSFKIYALCGVRL